MFSVHYKTNKLTLKEKADLIELASQLCYNWRVDKLDCSVSISREPVDMSFSEIIEKFNDRCYFTVIYRQRPYDDSPDYVEVCFSTQELTGPVYFLWIFVDGQFKERILENLHEHF